MALPSQQDHMPVLVMGFLAILGGIALVTFPKHYQRKKRGKRSPPGELHGKQKKNAEHQANDEFAAAKDIIASQGLQWNAFKRWHDNHLEARTHLMQVFYTRQSRLEMAPSVPAHTLHCTDHLDDYYQPHWRRRELRSLVDTIKQQQKNPVARQTAQTGLVPGFHRQQSSQRGGGKRSTKASIKQ
jgi:hypothetical protein